MNEREKFMEYKLLDHFAEIMQVSFLSELKDKENMRDYKAYIQALDDDAYSLED